MSSDEGNDDDVFLSPSAENVNFPHGNYPLNHIGENANRRTDGDSFTSSGYHSRATSGYTNTSHGTLSSSASNCSFW